MKINFLDAPNEDVRIEIIPLIDIIFCILTFFILAAVGLTRQQAIDLDLPSANTGNPLPPQGIGSQALQRERLYVSVDAIGQVYLDQQPVTLNLLYDVLLQHQQVSPEGLIVLYASRDARYEDVIQVLDLLREVGGDRVALATLPGESLDASPVPGLESPLPGQTDPQQDDLLNPSPFPSGVDPLTPGSDDPTFEDRLQQLPQNGQELAPLESAPAPDEPE
ncbi:ExbD/TolR family protein [Leptolyngbya iicbica]|uniref:Biopolymer transporter ExbD n=2 Tax=Cyanophyceae TaxID=3028117 RepID=A0A4Q7DZE1_9CYAN|nr:biopolymer transporter ExbD [Leptolyngbya sp. LK]RZM74897.1 biopolymer transporter ExbD [Leptolyngbya sp. LK]